MGLGTDARDESGAGDADDPGGSLDDLLEYVESSLSFATSSYNRAYLDRRVSARIRRRRVDDYDGYLSLLRDDEDEQEALLNALSVNVTSFFRNPEVWDGIREVLA